MARAPQKDLFARLADAGELAMKTLADAPGGERIVAALAVLRERTDELQRRVRGLEQLEQRLAELERRVDELSGGGSSPKPAKSSSASSSTSSKAANKTGTTEASNSRAADSGS